MTEFLVRIAVALPAEMADAERASLLHAEAERGRALLASGHLVHIWRLPGRHANVSVYRAVDGTELHELLSSLPLHPWMSVDVDALAAHPLAAST